MEVLRRGSRARQKAATALNTASSRSHSIYSIVVSQQVPTCPARHLHTSSGLTTADLALHPPTWQAAERTHTGKVARLHHIHHAFTPTKTI